MRTKHLKDSTVTFVLIGESTWSRRWVDWEIYSSLCGYGERTANLKRNLFEWRNLL
ncbi:TIR domain-containing protein [Paenibacillus maysiensis]|uniref:TIR domain-containing protein n=1 Tax=Paenibacillus maysiensis TaxID=1155954 RepID=UPI001ADFF181